MVFFSKKNEILEIENLNKIQMFSISFFIFQHFWHFVFYLTYPKLSKYYGIFCSVLLEGLEIFTKHFWKILKVLLKKILICEIVFFPKFCGLIFVFFYFFIILTFYFQFRLSVLVKRFQKFLCFLILWIRDFIKKFWKS